jgi:5-hydroxytryptamine receptor 7
MAGVVAAAIAATVVAVSGSSDLSGEVLDGGGGRGAEGGDRTQYLGGSHNLSVDVTDLVVGVVTDMSRTATPAALRRALNSTTSVLPSSLGVTQPTTLSQHTLNLTSIVGGVLGIINNASSNNATVTSNKTEIARPESPYEVWAQVLIAIILGFLILGTIIGNCLVCISVAIVKRLQTPSNLLIVSLAVADLLVAIIVMPLAATLQIYDAWVLKPWVCDMWTTTDVLLCTASILNLCMISVDRYFVITRPFQYAMKRTPKRMAIMITIVWVTSAVVSIPPVFGWKGPHEPFMCYISMEIGYQIYATLCAFYLPLIVMIFVYFKIWLVSSKIAKAEARSQIGSFDKGDVLQLGQTRASRDSNESCGLPNGSLLKPHYGGNGASGNGNGDDPESCERLQRRRFTIRSLLPTGHKPGSNEIRGGQHGGRVNSTKERKATKTLGIIMGCFTLCWLPFFILAVIKTFCTECQVPGWLDAILMWLGYCNSFLNPVIYARFNREFRTPFKEILLFRCRGINTRMRSESYVEQYGGGTEARGGTNPRNSLRPPVDLVVRYNSQGHTVVHVGNGSANSQSESKI